MPKTATKRVGIVVAPSRLYCRQVVHGIAAVGAEAGWQWTVVPTEDAPILADPASARLDGVIGFLEGVPPAAGLLQSSVPVVDFSSAPPVPGAARVMSDDVAVGRLAAAHLLSLGLPNYAFLGRSGRGESGHREQGFAETLEAAGLPCERFHRPAAGTADDPSEERGDAFLRWVAGLPKPVGVLAYCDDTALHLLAACHRLGIAVPGAIAILGVDNDEMFCDLANPAISSIALSTQRIGYEAARMLDHRMRSDVAATASLLVAPAAVVPRASTGLPAIVDPEVAAAVRYIAMHVKDHLQVADVLREVLVSRRSLDQRFLKALGHTPAQEISRVQVEIAKQALRETCGSMDAVATMAGFKTAKQFGATFRKVTGVTPTAFRRQNPSLG